MKKNFLFAFISLCCLNVSSQSYWKVALGYNPNTESQMLFDDNTYITADSLNWYTFSRKAKGIYGSLGNGLNYGVAMGYKFNSLATVEVGLSYLQSKSFINKSYYKRTFVGGDWYSSTNTDTVSGTVLSLTPSLTLTSEIKRFTPYTRFGLIIGYSKKENRFGEMGEHSQYGYYRIRGVDKSTATVSWGVNAAIGILYSLSQNTSLSGEFNMVNLNSNFQESEITEFYVNNRPGLNQLTTDQKKTQYVDQVNSSDPVNRSEPRKALLTPTSFSSIGFSLGLIIKIKRLPFRPTGG